MTTFDHILNWNLKAGSHPFPGPDGGTCINEAAMIAAGFTYRAIETAEDMPPCFSQVISQFALILNDRMPDDQRQRLLPYVARLAGTADTKEIEQQRATFLAMRAVNVFAARALDAAGLAHEAQWCRSATSLKGARTAAEAAAESALAAIRAVTPARAMVTRKVMAEEAARTAWTAIAAAAAKETARAALTAAWAAAPATETAWDDAIATLDGVLAIGRQADTLDVTVIADRLERAKAKEAVHA